MGGKRPLKAARCTTPLADRSSRQPLLGRNSSSKVHVHEEGLIVRVPTRVHTTSRPARESLAVTPSNPGGVCRHKVGAQRPC